MAGTIKNIIIFVSIGLAMVLIYVFFIKGDPEEPSLISVGGDVMIPGVGMDTLNPSSSITQDFLSVLLNVKNIKLNDSIFSDPAFKNLNDSSIILTPDGSEGRPNPFAPFGSDNMVEVEETPSVFTAPPATSVPPPSSATTPPRNNPPVVATPPPQASTPPPSQASTPPPASTPSSPATTGGPTEPLRL